MSTDIHIRETIATYNRIAPDYILTYTPEMRRWEENSMDSFASMLPGKRVLVPGCGDGRHSRYLAGLGLAVVSFDLSTSMLRLARDTHPDGTYLQMDLRNMDRLDDHFDGIFATGCLYHLTKDEFADTVDQCWRLLNPDGVLYLTMKRGQGERFEPKPLPGYPGGEQAIEALAGVRFYAYYERDELFSHLEKFTLVREERVSVMNNGFELWLRKREELNVE